jgi:hypothetical protein
LQASLLRSAIFALPANQTESEDIQVDPFRNLPTLTGTGIYLSPSEEDFYDVIQNNSDTLTEYSSPYLNPPVTGAKLDSAAEDCTTGIALSTLESPYPLFPPSPYLYVADLTQAKISGGMWTAPGGYVNFPEFQAFQYGTNSIAVAPGSQLAVVAGEAGDSHVAVVQLPPSSGKGNPAFGDYVIAKMPNTPDGNPFFIGADPHVVTAYKSPNGGRYYGLVGSWNSTLTMPTYLGRIDLQTLMNAPRCYNSPGHQCVNGPHEIDPMYNLLNTVVRYVPD